MGEEKKGKLKAIYKELQGYLAQAPTPKETYDSIYEESVWNQYNGTVNLLSEISENDYSRFCIEPSRATGSGRSYINIVAYKQKLGGLVNTLQGEDFTGEKEAPDSTYNTINSIENLCERFHLVARQIRSRHDGRDTLDIQDEYDVQDLFHALLHLYFDDIRPEEWTPSYAGSSSRMDFLLKQEQVVIEIKKTRKGLDAKELGSQLIEDIARYQVHPDCELLICFVYDPEGKISNPRGIENDLNRSEENLKVKVLIRP